MTQADIIELKGLIADVKGDEEWYVSGIALAALDVTSKTTALVQQTAAAAQSTATYGFNAGIQLDIEGSKTKSESTQTTSQASQLAGNNIVIQAGNEEGNEALIKGSHLTASDSLSIAANEVNVLAGQETSKTSSNNKSVSGSVQVTAYGATSGISVSLNGSESESNSASTTHINSTLKADNIAITSAGDTTVRGANVDAERELALNVGGDLTVESVQDRHSSSNKSRGASAGVSLGGGDVGSDGVVDVAGSNGNVTGVNGGLNASNGRTYQTETLQTSLTAGETATIKVDGHTQINGALVATVDEEGKDVGNLTLDTETLGFSDLRNTTYSQNSALGISTGVGIGEEKGQDGKPTDNTEVDSTYNSSTLQYQNSSDYSVTKSLATVGEGNVTVGGDADSDSLTALNRDVENTEKDLFTVERNEGNVDVTVDHRLLTEEGRSDIAEDFKRNEIAFDAIVDLAEKESIALIGDAESGVEGFFAHQDNKQKFFTASKRFVTDGKNADNVAILNDPNATNQQKEQAYTSLANYISTEMGVPPAEALLAVVENYANEEVKGAYANGTMFVNDRQHFTIEDSANTVGHETQHHIDANTKPANTNEAYHDNREQYADVMGEATEDYLGFNYSNNDKGPFGGFNTQNGTKDSEVIAKNQPVFESSKQSAELDFRTPNRNEQYIINTLSGGDPAKREELLAAGCALIKCSAEFPVGSENYNYYKALEEKGKDSVEAQTVLKNFSEQNVVQGNTYPTVETVEGFGYGAIDKAQDSETLANNLWIANVAEASGLSEATVATIAATAGLLTAVATGGKSKDVPATSKLNNGGNGSYDGDGEFSTPDRNVTPAKADVIEIASGCKGDWCKALNKPEPNKTFKVDDNYSFSTDDLGRTKSVNGTLYLETKDRNKYQQSKAGKSGESGDEGGHLIASIFKGPGEKINLVPMNGNLNKGEWKKLEIEWADALKDGKVIKVNVMPVYSGESLRPDSFKIEYSINNSRPIIKDFKNSPGGT
ncbi:DNA/RNA non-specific endonuclease [Enterovibrio norvegicus]|uniref:DNA/RNA non-specific endonuclease n=1 Tax=Enterovibrio norvegicus TaxID=188144 RepID=UPI0013D3C00C|nr:DNA/RNA non-specific endonuclease [Enterovibrio norvegicus]